MIDAIPTLYIAFGAILIGFIGLIFSADKFVLGAASIAQGFGLSPIIVGLTIVSFGTSAPEIAVSISASLKQAGDLAIGNALGSNIANIAMVLAATTLVARIPVQKHILTSELPVLLGVTLIAGLFLFDSHLVGWEGAVLLGLIVPVMIFMVRSKEKSFSPEEKEEETEFDSTARPAAIFWFIIGLAALILSSEVLVWGAKTTAIHFGVSPLIVGLTVIAVGTSLPELAASIMSALKGHHEIALGNIVGSNIFNLLAVMSIPGLIHPPALGPEVFYRDYLLMLAVTVILAFAVIFSLVRNTKTPSKAGIGKATGILLLVIYVGYYLYLFNA